MKAYKQLYNHYEKTVYGFCLRMLINQEDAKDAMQTTFLKLFKSIKKFRFKSNLTTYLFSISKNVCYDILAKRKIVIENLDDHGHISGENQLNADGLKII